MKGGKNACACHSDPDKRYGPYFELTYKANGKTVNVKLAPEAAPLYKAASLQYRRLKLLLTRLEKLSQIILRNQAKKGIQAPAVNLRGLNALKQAYLSSTFKVAF